MALPLTETDKFLLLHAIGAPESRDRVTALLDLAGTGNMTGPASATDNALARYDGATGALLQNSGALLSDSNVLSGLEGMSLTAGQILLPSGSAAVPVYSFSSDTATGLYRVGSGEIGIASGGSQIARLGTASYFVAPSASPFILKALNGNSSGLLFYANTANDNASIVNFYSANLELGTSNTVYQTISSTGAFTLGASGGTQQHIINGNFVSTNAQAASVEWQFYKDATAGASTNTAQLRIGNSGSNEASIRLSFTNAAATADPSASFAFDPRNNANTTNFNAARVLMTKVAGGDNATMLLQTADAGTLTTGISIDQNQRLILGASGSTQEHLLNGAGLSANAGAATEFYIENNGTDSLLALYGGNSGASARMALYGSTHASLASVTQFISNSTVTGSISSAGVWVIGASGSTVQHNVIGGTLNVTSNATVGTNVRIASTDTGGEAFLLRATGTTDAEGAGLFKIYKDGGGSYLTFRTSDNGIVFGINGTTPTHRLNTGTAATASAGGSALPATPEGFITIDINGTARKIPYYPT